MRTTDNELIIGFVIAGILFVGAVILFVYGIDETEKSIKTRDEYKKNNQKWLFEGTSCPAGFVRIPNTERLDKTTGLTQYLCELRDYKEPDTKYWMTIIGSILTGGFLFTFIWIGWNYGVPALKRKWNGEEGPGDKENRENREFNKWRYRVDELHRKTPLTDGDKIELSNLKNEIHKRNIKIMGDWQTPDRVGHV